MGRDVGNLDSVNLIVAFDHMVEAVLPVHRYLRQTFLVKEQEATVAINNLLHRRRLAVFQNALKASVHFLSHRNLTGTGIGFGAFNVNCHAGALKLMVDVDDPVLHIQIADGQSTELGNSHSGVEQDENHLVVFAVNVIVVDKFQKLSHLIGLNCLAGNAVIHHYTGKLKSERVLDNQIIVYRHLEGRPQNAANSFYRAVALAVLLQLDEEKLGIGNLDLADFLPAEWLVLHQVLYKIVVHLGVWFDAGLGRKVTVDKLLNRNVLA